MINRLRLFAVLLSLGALVIFARTASAAPAAPNDIPLNQPNGAAFSARQWGDELLHGYETVEGYTILRHEPSGYWVYAALQNGRLAPAQVGANDAQPALPAGAPRGLRVVGVHGPGGLAPHLRPPTPPRPAFLGAAADESAAPAADAPTEAALSALNSGTQPVLVLLVEFTDRAHTYPAATYQANFFAANTNSVRSFYRQSSFNQLDLAPADENDAALGGLANDGVVGWLPLSVPHPNAINSAPQIVREALLRADPYVNFARFDADGSGAISSQELHLVVVTAGYEQAVSSIRAPYMWAHRGVLDGTSATFDGVALGLSAAAGGYAMFGEIHAVDSVTTHPATIGVMVHELGHDLAWPDLYDTSYPPRSAGVGNWSVMGGGMWNTDNLPAKQFGSSPALPDAFLKYYQGWLNPTRPGNGENATLPPAGSSPAAVLLGANPNGVDWRFRVRSGVGEYWLVEYRSLSGFDVGLPGCGLLVWHIDESVVSSNAANANRDRPLVQLVQADGRNDLYGAFNRGDPGDPYPGTSLNMLFDSASTPNSRFYSGTASGQGIGLLSNNCGSSMSFQVSAPENTQMYLPFVRR